MNFKCNGYNDLDFKGFSKYCLKGLCNIIFVRMFKFIGIYIIVIYVIFFLKIV